MLTSKHRFFLHSQHPNYNHLNIILHEWYDEVGVRRKCVAILKLIAADCFSLIKFKLPFVKRYQAAPKFRKIMRKFECTNLGRMSIFKPFIFNKDMNVWTVFFLCCKLKNTFSSTLRKK